MVKYILNNKLRHSSRIQIFQCNDESAVSRLYPTLEPSKGDNGQGTITHYAELRIYSPLNLYIIILWILDFEYKLLLLLHMG